MVKFVTVIVVPVPTVNITPVPIAAARVKVRCVASDDMFIILPTIFLLVVIVKLAVIVILIVSPVVPCASAVFSAASVLTLVELNVAAKVDWMAGNSGIAANNRIKKTVETKCGKQLPPP